MVHSKKVVKEKYEWDWIRIFLLSIVALAPFFPILFAKFYWKIYEYENISEYQDNWEKVIEIANMSEWWKIAIFIIVIGVPISIITTIISHIIIKKYIK